MAFNINDFPARGGHKATNHDYLREILEAMGILSGGGSSEDSSVSGYNKLSENLAFDNASVKSLSDAASFATYRGSTLKAVIIQVQYDPTTAPADRPPSVDQDEIAEFLKDANANDAELTTNGGYVVGNKDYIELTKPSDWDNFRIRAKVSGTHRLKITYITTS